SGRTRPRSRPARRRPRRRSSARASTRRSEEPSSPHTRGYRSRCWFTSGLAAELARDHHLLHLVGALADREDLGVAVEAADGVLLDVAVAAVDLHGLLGRTHREPAG